MGTAASAVVPPPDQLGFVTDDLTRTTAILGPVWGIDTWDLRIYDGDVLRWRTFRGEPGVFESRNAVAPGGRVGVVQPTKGPSVHLEALERNGPGLAYVTWFVKDLDEPRRRMRELSVPEVMNGGGHGLDGDGEFAYFDTMAELGVFTQYAVFPARRSPPVSRL